MPYIDILFPLMLDPLTYKCPEEISGTAQPGMIASAPLKNKVAKGIITSINSSPPAGRIRELRELQAGPPVLSKNMLKLLKWMSDYYLAPEGIVLKHTLPKEIFVKTKARGLRKSPTGDVRFDMIDIPAGELSPIREALSDRRYRTFLVHAPSLIYEYSLVERLINPTVKNVLVILPEVSRSDTLYNAVKETFQERCCLLHSRVSKGLRSVSLEGIIAGKHDIVIGTRSALFAPLKNVSLIIVLHEHSSSYKLAEGLRYNIRDVAVMRGFLEKSIVVLSSITPSIDTYFNSLLKKYILVKPQPVKRPKIRVIDVRFDKKVRPNISKTVFEISRNRINAGRKIMLVINRRGYSTLLLCRECSHTEDCGNCKIPLVMHKNERVLRCHYCGLVRDIPQRCSRCGGFELELLGTGTQRVQEDIEKLLGTRTIRFDSDGAKNKSEIISLLGGLHDGSTKVMIGTKMMTKHMGISDKFSMAAVLNIDASLNFPDFRASEKAFMELSSIIELIEPGGELLIQTRFPQNPLFKYLKENDYLSFVKGELLTRKTLLYPPYSKLLKLGFSGNAGLSDEIIKDIDVLNQNIEALGPMITKNKKGVDEFSVLLKSADRKALKSAARAVLNKYGNLKGINITLDVDPG